ncbi:hypothetical protein [Burkholderia plantarii]|uniref:hypothetical protein n=1 Tax=Burkholderia plantarii TaxID=41899 RepID=UPI001395FB9C|nr:hypothetical protein [Burkholderia plantarii]
MAEGADVPGKPDGQRDQHEAGQHRHAMVARADAVTHMAAPERERPLEPALKLRAGIAASTGSKCASSRLRQIDPPMIRQAPFRFPPGLDGHARIGENRDIRVI